MLSPAEFLETEIAELNRLKDWINDASFKQYTILQLANLKALKNLHLVQVKRGAISWDYSDRLENFNLIPIPPEIGRLTNLKFLDLSFNRLEKIPPEMGELKSIKWLNLSNNKITELPSALDKLIMLVCLNLKLNPIRKISPATFANIKNTICPRYILDE